MGKNTVPLKQIIEQMQQEQTTPVLIVDDLKKLTAFFSLLITIDRKTKNQKLLQTELNDARDK